MSTTYYETVGWQWELNKLTNAVPISPVSLFKMEPKRPGHFARLCSAWDFGRLPDRETVPTIRSTNWREAVDGTRLLTSCAYHPLRLWHGLPPLPYLGQQLAYLRDDESLNHV